MGRHISLVIVLGALCALAPQPARAQADTPSLAVLDVQARNVPPEVASFVTGSITKTAADTEAFRVVSGEEIRALLSLEAQRQLCGVESESCLAEIGGALGADYLVSGAVQKVGGSYVLTLSLMNVRKAEMLSKVQETFEGDESGFIDVVPAATVKLLGKALAGRQGTLVVSASEAGATVKVDGRIVGTTPLGPQQVTAGTHLVEIEKRGFITQQEHVKIKADAVTARSMALVPSPDFLESYEKSAKRMRLAAWISSGVAMAGLGAALVFDRQASDVYSDFENKRESYRPTAGDAADTYAELQDLSVQGSTAQTRSYVAAGIGGAAAIAAAYFWIAGDDPGRYSRFQVAAVPSADGAHAMALVRF